MIPAALALLPCASLGLALSRTRTRVRRAESELHELRAVAVQTALRDPLTGLLNEASMAEHLVHAAAHARRRVEPVSVLLIDVCGLGETNRRFGHEAGDALLCGLAECMRATLRAEDVYGRLRGDRFLVILAGTIGVQAEIVAERVNGVAERVEMAGTRLPSGIELTIGCATAVRATPEGLLEAASEQLEREKALRGQPLGA